MPINLPNGANVEEIVLPDGSQAERVIGPNGSTVWERNAIPDSGILRYTFEDNTATDSWSENYGSFDGTVNGATYKSSDGPDGQGAFDFDGTDDYITVPSGATDPIESKSTFSIYFEVNLDTLSDDLFIYSANGSVEFFNCYMDTGDGGDCYRAASNNNFTNEDDDTALADTWQNVVVTGNGDDLTIYVDGSQKDSITGATIGTDIGSLDIGRDQDGNRGLDGSLSDFRIYDKELTSTEVSNLDGTGSIKG